MLVTLDGRNGIHKPATGEQETVYCSKGRASHKDWNNPVNWSQEHVSNTLKYQITEYYKMILHKLLEITCCKKIVVPPAL